MTLYSRKLLLADNKRIKSEKKDDVSSCYMCYVCPDDCYLQPPPPSPPLPPPPPQAAAAASQKHHIPSILILMLCVLGAAFLVLSYLTIRRYRNCRRRNSPSSMENRINSMRDDYFLGEDHGPDTAAVDHHIWYIRTIGLSRSVIDSIAVFEYKKDEGLIEGVDCSVCLNEFQENERLRLLPKCSHAFHVSCIDTWLSSHKNCPVCRAPVSITNPNNNNSSSNVRSLDSIETNVISSVEENLDESAARDQTIENNREENVLLDDMASRIEKFRVVSDLADRRAKFDQESEPVRRSLSLDLSCASMIYSDFITKRDGGFSGNTKSELNSEMIIAKRDCKKSIIKSTSSCSTSCGISMQKGAASMKRSFSFSGKRSLRKKSISQESIPIRELAVYVKSQSISL